MGVNRGELVANEGGLIDVERADAQWITRVR